MLFCGLSGELLFALVAAAPVFGFLMVKA